MRLKHCIGIGETIPVIAQKLKRSIPAISARLHKLGLLRGDRGNEDHGLTAC